MKNALLLLLTLLCYPALSQHYDTIPVPVSMNVQMVFPSQIIKEPLIGSGDYQAIKDHNTLTLFAKSSEAIQTSLNVETKEGYYVFILLHNEKPPKLFHVIQQAMAEHLKEVSLPADAKAEVSPYAIYAERAAKQPAVFDDIGLQKEQMKFYVDGIYIRENHLYVRVNIENKSTVPYDIDYIRFVVRSKGWRSLKKTVNTEEPEKRPLYVFNKNNNRVGEGQRVTQVYVFEKFVIDRKERFYIEFWEKQGDRELEVEIRQGDLLGAKRF